MLGCWSATDVHMVRLSVSAAARHVWGYRMINHTVQTGPQGRGKEEEESALFLFRGPFPILVSFYFYCYFVAIVHI